MISWVTHNMQLKSFASLTRTWQIFSVDSLGHMGVRGKTGFEVINGTDFFPHSVTFGFEFEPSQLVSAVKVDWVKKNVAEPIGGEGPDISWR
jgi:hypothetical protein